jgi:hypothetical protein
MPEWVKALLDDWIRTANLTTGKRFRRVHKTGKAWGEGLTEKAVWNLVRDHAQRAGIEKLAPHDLRRLCRIRHKRRTCARLCHAAGGELEQIQFLLGHVSIQTHGAIPWLQAAHPIGFKRSNRHRTRSLRAPDLSGWPTTPELAASALHCRRGAAIWAVITNIVNASEMTTPVPLLTSSRSCPWPFPWPVHPPACPGNGSVA